MKTDVLTSGYVSMDHIIRLIRRQKSDLRLWLRISRMHRFFTEDVL